MPPKRQPGSEVYVDSAYTDYTVDNDLEESSQIFLKVMRKNNSLRQDQPWNQYIKQSTRHDIETVFSGNYWCFSKIYSCLYLARVFTED